MTKKTFEYSGETKTIAAWARDPRCACSEKALRYRLGSGWSFEDALATPKGERRGKPATSAASPEQTPAPKPKRAAHPTLDGVLRMIAELDERRAVLVAGANVIADVARLPQPFPKAE